MAARSLSSARSKSERRAGQAGGQLAAGSSEVGRGRQAGRYKKNLKVRMKGAPCPPDPSSQYPTVKIDRGVRSRALIPPANFMPPTARDAALLAVGATSTAVAVWLYWRRLPHPPPEQPVPLATRLPVLPAASLTDGAAAAAVRHAGVCVVHDALSADELAELGQRLTALTPRKMQNRRPQRWEHVHDPASDAFKRPAM